MKKIEFQEVYLEIPEELVNEEKGTKTVEMSLEDLQKKLEETQSLNL